MQINKYERHIIAIIIIIIIIPTAQPFVGLRYCS